MNWLIINSLLLNRGLEVLLAFDEDQCDAGHVILCLFVVAGPAPVRNWCLLVPACDRSVNCPIVPAAVTGDDRSEVAPV